MTFISATIITYNEERNIERCLNSLIGIADEIVIVDSMSTDATLEICERYGCKITQRPFSGYGSQRQYAAGLTNGRYVLSIDADEVISEELRNNLIRLKTQGLTHRMYSFHVVNYICGRAMHRSGMKSYSQTKLFDRRYANWDLLDVGERLNCPGEVNPEPVKGDIYHYRCNSFDELDNKELRHARMRGRVLAAAGVRHSATRAYINACLAYLRCYLNDGAFRDGLTGRRIARSRFLATIAAMREARKIKQ